MHDVHIREAVEGRLRAQFAGVPDTLIRHELGVCEGRRRVDVAAVNGHLDGWEIKSDADTLRRLADQATVFSTVLDRATLVTTDRHLSAAVDLLPPWWGLWRAHEVAQRGSKGAQSGALAEAQTGAAPTAGDGVRAEPRRVVRLTQVRRPRMSPVLDPLAVAQLLWREEAMALLRLHGHGYGLSGRARYYVWERLAQTMSLGELRRSVREQLRARPEWPGGQRPSSCGGW